MGLDMQNPTFFSDQEQTTKKGNQISCTRLLQMHHELSKNLALEEIMEGTNLMNIFVKSLLFWNCQKINASRKY